VIVFQGNNGPRYGVQSRQTRILNHNGKRKIEIYIFSFIEITSFFQDIKQGRRGSECLERILEFSKYETKVEGHHSSVSGLIAKLNVIFFRNQYNSSSKHVGKCRLMVYIKIK